MIEKTIALPLRVSAHSETSRVVTWLTRDYGRLVTLCKGACRPKSPFLGQIDIPDPSELLFYRRDVNGLHIARECTRLKRCEAVRRDWRRYAMADYACGLLLQVSMPGEPSCGLYDLMIETLDQLERAPATEGFMLLWELRLLKALGMAPRLDGCLACGLPLDPAAGRSRVPAWNFSATRGGLVCSACAVDSERSAGIPSPGPLRPAPPDALAIMRGWEKALSLRSAGRTRCSPAQCAAIQNLLAPFLAHHLDVHPDLRAWTTALLAQRPAAITVAWNRKNPAPRGSRPMP